MAEIILGLPTEPRVGRSAIPQLTLFPRISFLRLSLRRILTWRTMARTWEQRKLGDCIEDYVEKTVVEDQYPVLTSSQQHGIILQKEYFAGSQSTTHDNVGYFVLPRGYFTYRSRSDNNTFVFNRNDLIDRGIISYFYPVFRVKNTDSEFMLRRLNHGMRRQLAVASEGTGQHVLSLGKFKRMNAFMPEISEQRAIGSFFADVDDLITLRQREHFS